MNRLRASVAALLVALMAAGWSLGATQSKKTSPSMLDKIGSATTGFFKGVKDTLTPKKKTASKSSTKQAKSSGLASWFGGSKSK